MRCRWHSLAVLARCCHAYSYDSASELAVVVSRAAFESRIRGLTFTQWDDFVESAGKQETGAGEERLKAGMTLVFAVVASATVGAIVTYLLHHRLAMGERLCCTIISGVLLAFAFGIYIYCVYAYEDPAQRLVSNILLGAVPLVVGWACYLLAVVAIDLCTPVLPSTLAQKNKAIEEPLPERESWWGPFTGCASRKGRYEEVRTEDQLRSTLRRLLSGGCMVRFLLFLSVWPGALLSFYLLCTVSTGFTGLGTFFDVMAMCFFFDMLRLALHLSFWVAPQWTCCGLSMMEEEQSCEEGNAQRLPGATKVVTMLCGLLYLCLLHLQSATGVAWYPIDPIKIHVLASLTSYCFFPNALMVARHCFQERDALSFISSVWCIAGCMLLVAMVFDVEGPNILGMGSMLFCIFFCAYTWSGDLVSFILMMFASTSLMTLAVYLSVHFAGDIRRLALLAR
mmetsp:Transcript_9263/g.21741  ORF Transcript_9263/g.21741 Transcript_9263/m.21741 type:complete len:453 (-) Transcript_9263:109-1467(-)